MTSINFFLVRYERIMNSLFKAIYTVCCASGDDLRQMSTVFFYRRRFPQI